MVSLKYMQRREKYNYIKHHIHKNTFYKVDFEFF